MRIWKSLLLVAFYLTFIYAKIYNILGCDVRDGVIFECDGSKTTINAEHEKILNDYMEDLAAYYRQQYPTTDAQQDDPPRTQPTYPQLCKVCD
ncbi:hypothetical protein M3Y97_00015200 [Aphelenchoides bicaudatus]|nr:hypothetical protein M3Y97_00015200 [Aphelenchoides bicaudatus]